MARLSPASGTGGAAVDDKGAPGVVVQPDRGVQYFVLHSVCMVAPALGEGTISLRIDGASFGALTRSQVMC